MFQNDSYDQILLMTVVFILIALLYSDVLSLLPIAQTRGFCDKKIGKQGKNLRTAGLIPLDIRF